MSPKMHEERTINYRDVQQLIGRAIRGWVIDEELTDSIDDAYIVSLTFHVMDVLTRETYIPFENVYGSSEGSLSGFGQPPITP